MSATIYIAYFTGLLAVSSMLMAWFHSNLPIHVLHFLRRIHFLRSDRRMEDSELSIWDGLPEFEATAYTWQDWLVICYNNSFMERFIVELITCPICLSFHLSFWFSFLIAAVIYYCILPFTCIFLLIPVATFTYPIIANIILKIYGRLNNN